MEHKNPERKYLFARTKAPVARPETFAITVKSYDTKANPPVVIGTRLDTGEDVSVYLREVEYNRSGRMRRSEIEDFAAPRRDRQHPGTSVGGILLIQEGIPKEDKVYGARWIQPLSHTPGEAEVFKATVHVTPVKYGQKTPDFPTGRPYSIMTVLYDGDFSGLSDEVADALKLTPPFKVKDMAELRESILSLLGDGIGVGVRVSDGEAFDAMYVSRKKGQDAEDALEGFMRTMTDIADDVDSGAMTVEVVPYGNIWAGPTTVDIMAKNRPMQARLNRFNEIAEKRNGETYPVSIYREAIVAVRLTRPDEAGRRSVFFTHFEPLNTRYPVRGLVNAIAYAQTDVMAPPPPKPDAPSNAQNDRTNADKVAAPAPASVSAAQANSGFGDGGFGDGGFDDGSFGDSGFGADDFTDADLMAAAGADAGHESTVPAEPVAAAPAPAPAPSRSAPRRYTSRAR